MHLPSPLPNSLVLAAVLSVQGAYWLDVPFRAQTENGCGAACIAMVMQYWQPQAGVDEPGIISRSLLEPGVKGTSAARMEEYFRVRGYRTYAFRGTWADLGQHLGRGRPLIAALQQPGALQAHYVVVTGIDDVQDLVLVNDPARGKLLKMRRRSFEPAWRRCDTWTLLALPPEKA